DSAVRLTARAPSRLVDGAGREVASIELPVAWATRVTDARGVTHQYEVLRVRPSVELRETVIQVTGQVRARVVRVVPYDDWSPYEELSR
ncbi:MAG TPA: hypothetical protein VEA99_04835, partial [Gemmatimonadaceae bacterium]|nr:hypothetical protein [Gemmatimonadaceae bacterium]